MLKGDLAITPFRDVITDLAASQAIGCLHVEGPDSDEALVYFKTGSIYSTFLPGRRPRLGARLISSGALAPEALEEALEAQATELQGWRLGELLVHLGFVESEVVEAFGVEQVRDACFEMSRWGAGKWKFRKNEKTREDISASLDAPGLLDEILRREQEWQILVEVVRGTDSVPTLGAGGLASADLALNQDEWALLCKVDGERSIHQLARDCGFTDFEAGQIVSSLVTTGLLEIEAATDSGDVSDTADAPISPRSAAERLMAAFSGGGDTDPAGDGEYEYDDAIDTENALPSYLNSLVMPLVAPGDETIEASAVGSEVSRLLSTRNEADLLDDITVEDSTASAMDGDQGYTSYALPPRDPDAFEAEPYADPDASLPRYSVGFGRRDFDDSLSAVSEALSALLGNQPAAQLPQLPPAFRPTDETDDEARARVIRDAAAAEMSAAHAEMEEQRRRFDDARKRAEETASADAAAEQDRLAEEIAAKEQAGRLLAAEAERVAEEAERAAAEAEAGRVAAAQEAERIAAEEVATAAAEKEAARVAAEEAARVAADEAARVAAEEAARVAAEQEAAALAAEEAAAAAAAAQKLAEADEAARAALAEQQRLVAEVDARLAAEHEAARHAQQQQFDALAAEQEAAVAGAEEEARIAAADAARFEAEAAADRAAAEEVARVAASEQEAARIAAAEAARVAAEQETARLAAEQEMARLAAEELARVAAEQAVAAAMQALAEQAPPPAPTGAPVMTDTASLMRELSSLGFDDEPASTPMPSRPNAPAGAAPRTSAAQADKGKKRKGLFGRG